MSDNVVSFNNSDNLLRPPPHNYQAEMALLGAILANNRAYERVSEFLRKEHFADNVNGRLYEIVGALIDKNQHVSAVTLKHYADSDEYLMAAGGMKYIASIAGSAVTIINAGEYGRLIYDLFLRRELIATGTDMVNHAYEARADETALDQVEESTARLTDLMGREVQTTAVMLEDAVNNAVSRWEKHDRGEIAGLSSGMVDLDREMGLMEAGDLLVLSGPQAMGKTSIAMNMAYNAAVEFKRIADQDGTKPKRVVIFSGEMSAEELSGRMITTYTGIQGPRKRTKPLTLQQTEKVVEFSGRINGLPLVIDSRGSPNVSYMRSRLRQEQRKGSIGLILIDYLQLMSPPPGTKFTNSHELIGYNAQGVKSLARDMSAPAILISSMNRKYEDRESKRPHMGDLRGSGDIEYAADFIAFCHREEYYLEQNEPKEADVKKRNDWTIAMTKWKNVGEVIIAKSRHGTTGTAKLNFDRTRTLWGDIAKEPEQQGLPLEAYADRDFI